MVDLLFVAVLVSCKCLLVSCGCVLVDCGCVVGLELVPTGPEVCATQPPRLALELVLSMLVYIHWNCLILPHLCGYFGILTSS